MTSYVNFKTVPSSPLEVFLEKNVLKICPKFTGKHSHRNAISIKLQSNFIEIGLRHGYSSVNLLHIFRTPFPENTFRRLRLKYPWIFLLPTFRDHSSCSHWVIVFSQSHVILQLWVISPLEIVLIITHFSAVFHFKQKTCKSNDYDLKEVCISFFISTIKIKR